MGGSYAVKKPVAWLGAVLLLALVVLAIVLPITVRKEEDVLRVAYLHVEELVPFERFAAANDPFNLIEETSVVDKLSETIQKFSDEQFTGQPNVWAIDGETGAAMVGITYEVLIDLVSNGRLGAVLNQHLPENVTQLDTVARSSDLGVPMLFGVDVIHGYATIFPVNLGMASAFSPDLVYRQSEITAIEASARGYNWNYAPMLDVTRDPRWGRISEGSGEDSYLTGTLGYAYIQGFQAQNRMAACVKHVGAYGIPQAGRDYTMATIGKSNLFNQYFDAYKRAFRAKPYTAMASFNGVDSDPAHISSRLMNDILRGKWGFDGFVVADWSGPTDLISTRTVRDMEDAGMKAIAAGVDMDMSERSYSEGLLDHLDELSPQGKTYREHLELSNKRILEVKQRMGLFDKPVYQHSLPESNYLCTEDHLNFAEEAALKSAVLLENKPYQEATAQPPAPTLPLSKSSKIFLVGEVASNAKAHHGSWSNTGDNYTSGPWEHCMRTIHQALPDHLDSGVSFTYAKGMTSTFGLGSEDWELYNEAVKIAEDSANGEYDAYVMVMGEWQYQSGEGASRTNITMSGVQLDLMKKLTEIAKTKTPRPKLVLVVLAGRPLAIPWEAENMDAILYAWANGSRGGPAVWKLLFGDVSPTGKLPVTMPRNVGQVPIHYGFHATRGYVHPDRWDEEWNGWRSYSANYIDSQIGPLYWFGYGLTYSTFTYSNIRVTPNSVTASKLAAATEEEPVLIQVSVDITRGAGFEGKEVTEIVQFYVRDVRARIVPVWKMLRGYARVTFGANQGEGTTLTATVTMDVNDDFGYFDEHLRYQVEPGSFQIIAAPNSRNEDVSVGFYVLSDEPIIPNESAAA